MESAISVERSMPVAFDGDSSQLPTRVMLWHGLDSSAWRVVVQSGLNFDAAVWTTRDGIEALRDACNAALIQADAVGVHRASWGEPKLEVV